MTNPVFAAIDIGYFNTKALLNDNKAATQKPTKTIIMPSLTPEPASIQSTIGAPVKLDTLPVTVNGKTYALGPDSFLLKKINDVPLLHEKFCESDKYIALFKGALAWLGKERIDRLVVGLPVHLLSKHGEKVKRLFTGTHTINATTQVTVEKVLVVPQPLGALIDYSSKQTDWQSFCDNTHLVIDPGGYTFDWIMARGLKQMSHYSGAVNVGLMHYFKRIADLISENTGEPYKDTFAISEGFQKNKFRITGRDYDLNQHSKEAESVFTDAINALVNNVGAGEAIDKIIVVGGGGKFVSPLIRATFPGHPLVTVEDAVMSNVRGLYEISRQITDDQQRAMTDSARRQA